jgi:four helix bundle protein
MKYSDLGVWKQAMGLVVESYRFTRSFPPEERYALASRMQRAALSIPSDVAEGHGRKLTGAFLNHISIAAGSLMELEIQTRIAHRLDYLDKATTDHLLETTDHVGRRLTRLRQSLAKEVPTG